MPTPKLQKQKGQVSQFMPSNNSARRPKLSIVIPSHNRGHDMVQVLIDLERQTMPPFEIVITDDKSDPKELKIITDHLRTSKNSIRFYKNKSALRLAGNANEAVSRAKGEYVTIVNDTKTPQIIQSDTLHIDEGNILVSPAIQPGSAYSFNIFSTEEEKTYRFILFTNPSLFGLDDC
jgi:GT2 family glycosyltransferase